MKYQIELNEGDAWFLYGLLNGDLKKMKTMKQTDMVKGAVVMTERIMKELMICMKGQENESLR